MLIFLYVLLAMVVLSYVWHKIRQFKNKLHRRSLKWRIYPIRTKWFRIFIGGIYAWMEVDFGRTGHHELVILFGCVDRFINWVWNKPTI
jgi:hypothetical protein